MAGERNTNQPVVEGAGKALDNFKYEIASEFGITLGGDRPSRENGRVGGEMTKRMVQLAERQLQQGTGFIGGGGTNIR
ncbi:MAG TPA: alpha/beta-type small acid-soluble spore protein [Desulfobacteria bacterium]|nr:alpha/beta-type small acid-soluble spore protein [Desulfobacteria bacterium]